MSDKYYMKIDGVKGPVTVKGFEGAFELAGYRDIAISNPFASTNNGQAYGGTPDVSSVSMTLSNVSGTVNCILIKDILGALPLKTVTIYEVAKLNNAETSVYDITLDNVHLLHYERHGGNRNVSLTLGNPSAITINNVDIDESGKAGSPQKVKYDLQKHETS